MATQTVDCDHIIFVEWLRQSVLVFNDLAAARTELEPFGGSPEAGAGGAGYAVNEDGGSAVFWMVFPGGRPGIGTLVHEAIHIVDYLCEFAGIPITSEAAEVRCYMVEWLTARLMDLYGLVASYD